MNSVAVDTSKLEAAIPKYREATGHDLAYIINRAGRNVAFQALKNTPRGNKQAIEELREVVAHQIRGADTKTGKLGRMLKKPRPVYFATTKAINIIAGGLVNRGQKVPPRIQMNYTALKMVAARLRGVGFLASGWLEGIRVFSDATAKAKRSRSGVEAYTDPRGSARGYADGASQYGAAKGEAIPATPGDEVSAMLSNMAYGKNRELRGQSRPGQFALLEYAGPALQKAIDDVAADMESFAESRLSETTVEVFG